MLHDKSTDYMYIQIEPDVEMTRCGFHGLEYTHSVSWPVVIKATKPGTPQPLWPYLISDDGLE